MISNACSYRYYVVDVFTDRPLEGNSLAVFLDATGLDDITIAKIAQELNLSETTFAFPSVRKDCAARVRICTPRREMDFAEHPTIGTDFVCCTKERPRLGSSMFAWKRTSGRSLSGFRRAREP